MLECSILFLPTLLQMWDADSLLPVGEAFVDLSCLLRQQERVVSVAREYEITSSIMGAPDMSGHSDDVFVDSSQRGAIVLGRLLVRPGDSTGHTACRRLLASGFA